MTVLEDEVTKFSALPTSSDSKNEKPDRLRLPRECSQATRFHDETAVDFLRYAEDHDLPEGPFERAYRPDVMERDMKLAAMINNQIDKAVSRLVRQKEFERLYPETTSVIDVPPHSDLLAATLAPAAGPPAAKEGGARSKKAGAAEASDAE